MHLVKSTLRFLYPFSLLVPIFFSTEILYAQNSIPDKVNLSGVLQKWHKVTLSIEGPEAKETDSTNPFTDYRLMVTFSQGGSSYEVPGYFAADGMAGETSSDSGNVWRVHFAPDQTGSWDFTVSFRQGANVALNDSANAGTSVADVDGLTGSIDIATSDKSGRDFRAKGRLRYVGERYLQFAETGEYFLKAGADAPENLLAYEDFDNTPDYGNRRKSWSAHVSDWNTGDPVWKGDKGKGLIGAINYLASEGQNVFSFLTMNINGDDRNVFPYISDNSSDRLRMDCSKLDQWEVLFEHADSLGMYLHFKTQETENDQLLDGGALGNERKLYYRELIARYGHHLALNWNIGEENTNTESQRKEFAQYFYDHDPYRHHVVLHTYPNQQDQVYDPLLGNSSTYTGVSVQTNWNEVHDDTKKWVEESLAAGKNWVVANDEQGGANTGVKPDGNGNNHDDIRIEVLWGNLIGGGAGVEYYFGYGFDHSDLTCEDFRSRDNMWDYNRYALEFFNNNSVSYWEMMPDDDLAAGNDNWCLAKTGEQYVVYLTGGDGTTVNLGTDNATYEVKWFDPRNGGGLQNGSVQQLTASATADIGTPPSATNEDWVVLLNKTTSTNAAPTVSISSNPDVGGLELGDSLSLEATAQDSDGTITKVVFYDGSTILGEQLVAPYTQNLVNLQPGFYNIYAIALDNENAQTSSDTLRFVIPFDGNSCPAMYKEEGGLVVFEPESIPVAGDWDLQTSIDGYSGAGYIRWGGSNQFNNPGQGLMEYTIQIQTPGTYRFNWRSRITIGNDSREHNDTWLRFPDADDFYGEKNGGSIVYPHGSGQTPNPEGAGKEGWFKIYMSRAGEWHWSARTSDNDAHDIYVVFNAPGVYTMQLSGRSEGHAVDRIVLYTDDTSNNDAQDLNLPESLCEPSPNQAPTVSFLAPTQNASFDEEDLIGLELSVSDPNLDPITASIFHNDTLVKEFTSAPFTFDWGPLAEGVYTLKAVAKDNSDAVSDTAQITFSVNKATLDTLLIIPDSVNLPETAGDTTVSVVSNVNWAFDPLPGWVTVDPTSGDGDETITITYEENPSMVERKALITLRGNMLKDSLWLIQAGNPLGSMCGPTDSIWVSSIAQTSVTLNWNRVISAASYRVQFREPNDVTWQTVTGLTDTTVTLDELNEASLYVWAVGTDCEDDQTLWTIPSTFQTEGYTLEPVENLSPSYQSPVIYLVWADKSDIETGFIIERKKGDEAFAPIDTVRANTSFFVDTFNIELSTVYTYRIITYHPEIAPGISEEVSITTSITTSIPGLSPDLAVSLYPNPASEFLIIENVKGKTQIQWMDLQGKLISASTYIFSGRQDINRIDVPDGISSGLYLLRMLTEEGISVSRKIQVRGR
ncbi:MAG: DUF5060 domain-containing protein [Bacteroidota bacterium]